VKRALAVALAPALALLLAASASADAPTWAYPVKPPGAATVIHDDGTLLDVPGSSVRLTRTQITAMPVGAPDWHPDEHPAMPGIVGRTRAPDVYACTFCHLPNGAGRPENAGLVGLSAAYLRAQLAAFREGRRTSSAPGRLPITLMTAIASKLTNDEIDESTAYFASLPFRSYIEAVEATDVPRTSSAGWAVLKTGEPGSEPLGERVVEVPVDTERFERRDSRTEYVAYVPVGSLARGAALVNTGAGRTLPCAGCHGPALEGLADVPRIASRSPSYLFRQLHDLRNGTRTGPAADLMKPVVENLTDADLIAIVGYLASRRP
jgi:cytochrome c553